MEEEKNKPEVFEFDSAEEEPVISEETVSEARNEKKVCRVCGNEMEPGDSFCIVCGARPEGKKPEAAYDNRRIFPPANRNPLTYHRIKTKAGRKNPAYLALSVISYAIAAILTIIAVISLYSVPSTGIQLFGTDYSYMLMNISAIIILCLTAVSFTVIGCFMFFMYKR